MNQVFLTVSQVKFLTLISSKRACCTVKRWSPVLLQYPLFVGLSQHVSAISSLHYIIQNLKRSLPRNFNDATCVTLQDGHPWLHNR